MNVEKRVRVTSDGTPAGTKVILPDGANAAEPASRIEIVIVPDKPVTCMVTYEFCEMDIQAAEPEKAAAPDALAEHTRRRFG